MHDLTLRPATRDDFELVYEVKRAAFKNYVDQVWGWNEDEQRAFHARRFAAQELRVINIHGIDAGYIAVDRTPESIDVHQLYVLPEHQSRGIGRECMLRVMADARDLGVPVHLQVLKVNSRARAFYERLGFGRSGETDTHVLMRWQAGPGG